MSSHRVCCFVTVLSVTFCSFRRNKFHCLLSFYVPNDPTRKWSTMFGILNAALQRLPIEDYALSQTSLEQVFLLFAQQTVSDKSR